MYGIKNHPGMLHSQQPMLYDLMITYFLQLLPSILLQPEGLYGRMMWQPEERTCNSVWASNHQEWPGISYIIAWHSPHLVQLHSYVSTFLF